MLDMDAAVFSELEGDATLMSIVTGIYWYLAPKGATGPYLILTVAGGTNNAYKDTDLRFGHYRIIAEGTVGLTVMQAADRVRQVMHNADLTISGSSSPINCKAGESTRNVQKVDDDVYFQGITEIYIDWKNVYS